MRNLKRALSLLLSSTMVLGMMVMGSSAVGYQDVDASNDNQEAIEVLQAVGIMSGVDEDNFDPDGAVTRNQMAVIMAHLLNLDYDYYRGTNPFTDVPEWAAPYVAACAAEGVVAGVGDGKFGGDNKVTAAQASLMIMKALGYFQYQEDFGSDWQVATIRQASYIDLFNNINANAESALTRGQVAQLVLNGLKSDMVEFTGDVGTTATVGDTTIHIGYRAEYTPKTGSDKKYNSLVGGTTDIAEKNQYYIQLGEELYNGKLTEKADTDAFDRPATTWRYDYKVIGTYMNDPDLTYTAGVDLGDIYADLGLSKSKVADRFSIDGKEQTTTVTVSKNNTTSLTNSANGVLTQVWYDENENGSSLIITEIETYVGKVNSIVKDASDDRYVTLNALRNPGALNNKFETGKFAAQDLITYTAAWNENTNRYDIQSVDALELTTTGTLTQWKGSNVIDGEKGTSNANFTVDSTLYNYSVNNYVADEDGAPIAISDFAVNESEVNVYLDDYGYAIYVSGVEAAKNYAAVIGYGSSNQYGSTTRGVTLLLPDGTQKTVTAKIDDSLTWNTYFSNTAGVNNVSDGIADLVTYTVGDNDVYNLEIVSSTAVGATGAFQTGKYSTNADNAFTSFTNGKSEMKINTEFADVTAPEYNTPAVGTYYTTSETVFMVATQKDPSNPSKGFNYNVYTGYANAPGIVTGTDVNGMAFVMDGYYKNQINVVYIDATQMAGISGVDTFFVKDDSKIITDSDGRYYVFPAIVDGAETTIKIDPAIAEDWDNDMSDEALRLAAKGVYAIDNVTVNSKGIITNCNLQNTSYFTASGTGSVAANGVVLGIGANKNTATYWAYNKDTTVYYVDKDYKAITVSSIDSIATDSNDLVFAAVDSATKVLTDVIVVEVADTVPVTYGVAASTGVEFYDGSTWVSSLAGIAKDATVEVRATDVTMKPVINGITLTFSRYDGAHAVYSFTMPAYNIAAGAFTTTAIGYGITNAVLQAGDAAGEVDMTLTPNTVVTGVSGATVTYDAILLRSAAGGTGNWLIADTATDISGTTHTFTGVADGDAGVKVQITVKINDVAVATYESNGYSVSVIAAAP